MNITMEQVLKFDGIIFRINELVTISLNDGTGVSGRIAKVASANLILDTSAQYNSEKITIPHREIKQVEPFITESRGGGSEDVWI